jgi:hypothetical protein
MAGNKAGCKATTAVVVQATDGENDHLQESV